MSSALTTSGISSVHPGYSRTSMRSSERNVGARVVHALEQAAEERRVVRLRVAILREQPASDAPSTASAPTAHTRRRRHRLPLRLRALPEETRRTNTRAGRRPPTDSCGRSTAATSDTRSRSPASASCGRRPSCRPRRRSDRAVTNWFDERVRVRRDVATVHHERRIARALADVAEHLVVGAVLADDEDDVLDRRRLARPLGNGARRDAGARRGRGRASGTPTRAAGGCSARPPS